MSGGRRVRGIFFDLDDTLIHYTHAERAALTAGCRLANQLRPEINERGLALALLEIYAEQYAHGTVGYVELATLTVDEFRMRISGEALRLFGIDDPDLTATLVAAYRKAEAEALRAFAYADEVLTQLRPRFYLGIITNGPSSTQREKIAAVSIADRFDAILVDTEFGCPKPDPRLFAHAARRAELTPSELIFVGNSLEADIEGARRAGWTSVWLNAEGEDLPPGAPIPDYTIASLDELLTLPPIVAALDGTKSV